MKTSIVKKFSRTVLVAALACALPALAGLDNVGLGEGTDGPLSEDKYTRGKYINFYARLMESRKLGPQDIQVDDARGFNPKNLVLVLQTANGGAPVASGNTKLVGRWEFARITRVNGNTLTLSEPLLYEYAGMATQVIRVPEYTEANITGTLSPMPWDGATGKGGVLAFLVQGSLKINSQATISATGMGFKGGMSPAYSLQGSTCSQVNSLDARIAGGISATEPSNGFQASRTSAGGAGQQCEKIGGGGGGNFGAGGNGGANGQTPDGMGGAQVKLEQESTKQFVDRLIMGGGGGWGYTKNGTSSEGGTGGGIIFIRANTLDNEGSIEAKGESGEGKTESASHGGGGAGGSIYLLIAQSAKCSLANRQPHADEPFVVVGGKGGSASGTMPAGGGGAGGRLMFHKGSGDCEVRDDDNAFGAGTSGNPSVVNSKPNVRLAANGQPGTYIDLTRLFGGGPVLLRPVVTLPFDKAELKETTPKYVGTSTYSPGTWVDVYVDDKPEPVGTVEVDKNGNWSIHPTRSEDILEPGPHTVYAVAHHDGQDLRTPPSNKVEFTVVQDAPPPEVRDLVGGGAGCGASASGGAPSGLAMMGLALLSTLRARRRQK